MLGKNKLKMLQICSHHGTSTNNNIKKDIRSHKVGALIGHEDSKFSRAINTQLSSVAIKQNINPLSVTKS